METLELTNFVCLWMKAMSFIITKNKQVVSKTTCRLAAICEACSQKAKDWKAWVTLANEDLGINDHYHYLNDKSSEAELKKLFRSETLDIDALFRQYIAFNFTDEEVLEACHSVGFNVAKSKISRWKKTPSNPKYSKISANEFLLLYKLFKDKKPKQSNKPLVSKELSEIDKMLINKIALRAIVSFELPRHLDYLALVDIFSTTHLTYKELELDTLLGANDVDFEKEVIAICNNKDLKK